MTAQPSSENTVLWSQRHCGLVSAPSTSAALSTTKPASTKRKVSRSSCSSGMPKARGGATGMLAHARLGRVQHRGMQHGRAEQAIGAPRPAPNATAPRATRSAAARSPGKRPGQHHRRGAQQGQHAAHARLRHEPALGGVHGQHQPDGQRHHRAEAQARAAARRRPAR